MQRSSRTRQAQQETTWSVFVISIILDHSGVGSHLAYFQFANVPLNRTSEGMASEFKLTVGKLAANLIEGFHRVGLERTHYTTNRTEQTSVLDWRRALGLRRRWLPNTCWNQKGTGEEKASRGLDMLYTSGRDCNGGRRHCQMRRVRLRLWTPLVNVI